MGCCTAARHVPATALATDVDIHRQPLGGHSEPDSMLTQRLTAPRSGGQSLTPAQRSWFEPRLGVDLSQVRIHADGEGSRLAEGIRAQAFTQGNDITFGPGRFQPETAAGRRLLGHELIHVAQQDAAAPVSARSGAVSSSTAASTVFRQPETSVPPVPIMPPFIGMCGPDVTTELASAVAGLRSSFGGLTLDQKEECCDTLDSLTEGGSTWDVIELHNNAWIYQDYRPDCATEGIRPPCGSSVQVGRECYYAGSANYVIFGTMCSLCHAEFGHETFRFTEESMLGLIDLYKGGWFFGLVGQADNYWPSREWASAGYYGWPSGGSPPAGDKPNCLPYCPTAFTGPSFQVRLCPHLDPEGQCGEGRRSVRIGRRRRPGSRVD